MNEQRHIHYIWGLVLCLVVFGQVMLFSATAVMGAEKFGSEFYYLQRQFPIALGGLALMYLVSSFDVSKLQAFVLPIFTLLLFLLAATYFPQFGHSAGGAHRWMNLGPIHFQPSELAKIVLPLYLAAWLANPPEPKKWLRKICYALPVAGLLLLIFKQPDLGTTVLLAIICFSIFFLAGMRLSRVIASIALVTTLFAVALYTSEYRQRRLIAFLNPWEDPHGSGFQTIQSFLSFYSGKLFGVGLGNGNSKLFFLPEVHTDFIFALVGEELGFVGAAGLLLVYLCLIYLLLKITVKSSSDFGKYLSFGLTLVLLLQITINLGGVTGLFPVKGTPLPFISWGRTSLVVNFLLVGCLLSVLRHSVTAPATVDGPKFTIRQPHQAKVKSSLFRLKN